MRRFALALVLLVCLSGSAFAQANGTLQIHYMDVGQGDAAVLISPQGEVVLFDNGVLNQCGKPVAYLQSLGVTKIDYHIASHYHSDHIGCTGTILGLFPLQKFAYDRGASYTTATYTNYVNAVGAKRSTAAVGQVITLDGGTATPVTITFKALNGNGTPTTDENDSSLVAVVKFGNFEAEFGGDLSGSGTGIVDPDPNVPSACSYTVSPTSYAASSAGGAFSVAVSTTAGCTWSASSNVPWVTIAAGVSGTGTGSVTFSVASNSGGARSGTATVATGTVTITQGGSSPPPAPDGTCPRPSSAPAGATAICKDGTYSFSQNRSGTCSRHGGVQCWLCPGLLCNALTSSAPLQASAPAYADIESSVAPFVGQVEVYKVHHHGSRFSSNSTWLSTTTPKVGIISVGNANNYGHPTAEALARLHAVGTKTYWTSAGNGTAPVSGLDAIVGNVVVEVAPDATTFAIKNGVTTDVYPMWEAAASPPSGIPVAPAFGMLDTPANGAVVAGEVPVTGWALDDAGITGVEVYRSAVAGEPVQSNGLVFLGTATLVEGARPDVAAAFPAYPGASRAGWGLMVLSNMLPNQGNGAFTLYAFAKSLGGDTQLLGSKQIVAANASSAKPFGTIDTPGQGATVSGVMTNFGWALTPRPHSIPPDGSTINVYIDGVFRGHPSYNHFRADIATLFPGLANSNGAVGVFQFDTTTLTNGVHSIEWSVVDSAGHAQGIGSRFFIVQSATAPPVQSVNGLVTGGGILHVNPVNRPIISGPRRKERIPRATSRRAA